MVGRQAFVRIFWSTMGACLMTVISEHYFIKYGAYDSSSALRLDPGRIAAQIVTGIGFLGTGLYIPGIMVTLLSLLSLLV